MNDTVKGAIKSKTIWIAVVLAVLSNLEPQLKLLETFLDPATVQKVGTAFSLVMIVLRTITTTALADKVHDTTKEEPK